MKKIYGTMFAIIGLQICSNNLKAYTITFENGTGKTIFVTAQAKYTIDNGTFEQGYNSDMQYKSNYQQIEKDFKRKLLPGQKDVFNYVNTKDVSSVEALSFSVSDSTDPYSVPEYTCDATQNKALNKRLTHGNAWYKPMPQNPGVFIYLDPQGKITAARDKPKNWVAPQPKAEPKVEKIKEIKKPHEKQGVYVYLNPEGKIIAQPDQAKPIMYQPVKTSPQAIKKPTLLHHGKKQDARYDDTNNDNINNMNEMDSTNNSMNMNDINNNDNTDNNPMYAMDDINSIYQADDEEIYN